MRNIILILIFLLISGSGYLQSRLLDNLLISSFPQDYQSHDLNQDPNKGAFLSHTGEVLIMHPGENKWINVDKTTIITPGSIIKTGADSYARFQMNGTALMELNEDSSVEISKNEVEMFYGALRAKIEDISKEGLKIKTPVAVAAARGTLFAVIYEEKNVCEAEVYEGKIEFSALKLPKQPLKIKENLYARFKKGQEAKIIGEITDLRELRWIHLEERIRNSDIKREIIKNRALLLRLRGMLRSAAKSETDDINKEIKNLQTRNAGLENNLKINEKSLDEINEEYARIREEKARSRRELIQEQRQNIIKQRLQRIEEEKERRRKRLK
ncbi:MAG: FecR family protein [Elusimicrobiota bacterium]